jgi:hypothetical protein
MLSSTPIGGDAPTVFDSIHFLQHHGTIVSKATTSHPYRVVQKAQQPAPQPPEPRRRLRFAKSDQVIEIPHIDDLSDEEVRDVWLSPQEFKAIRKRAIDAVAFIESMGGEAFPPGLCIRGLDQNTHEYSKKRQALQDLLYEVIRRIQPFKKTKQEGDGERDVIDNLIAEMCIKYTSASVAAAARNGELDAREEISPR